MTGWILGAALAGLVGSPHCVAMCGGFAGACAEDRIAAGAWHAGRLTTYAALGALAAAVGRVLPGPAWVPTAVSGAFLAWFAAGLAGLVRPPHLPVPGLATAATVALRRPGPAWRFALGLCTGLVPCGLVYAALAVPVATTSPLAGAAAMLAFGAGTVPALALAARGMRRMLAGSLPRRRLLAAAVLVAGLAALAQRQPGTPEEPLCHGP